MKIDFPNTATFEVAAAHLQQLQQSAWRELGDVTLHADELAITVAHPVIAALLQRLALASPTILPMWHADMDQWRLTGAEPFATARLLTHVAAFLLPTYGTLPQMMPTTLATQGASTDAGPVLSATGENGAKSGSSDFVWQTPAAYRKQVLDKLEIWLRLEAEQPRLHFVQLSTYAQLLDRVQGALARSAWNEAEVALAEIERRHLTSFENQQYLRIQLLAQRQEWLAIWRDPAYLALTKQRLPRIVRAALIQAYHYTQLLPFELEQRFDQALEAFRQTQPRVQHLLDGRYGLTDDSVVRTFGYAAVQAQDRPALAQLLALPDLASTTRACLDALSTFLPPLVAPPPPTKPVPTTADVTAALRSHSYDVALAQAEMLPDPSERTLQLWRVASLYSGAIAVAMAAWEGLRDEERAWLQEEPGFRAYQDKALPPPPSPALDSWDAWFAAFIAGTEIALLEDALDKLAENVNDLEWSPASLRRLVDTMEDAIFVENYPAAIMRCLRRAIATLSHALINDRRFPQTTQGVAELYGAVYEACYNGLIIIMRETANEANLILLTRLLHALLIQKPASIGKLVNDLNGWVQQPSVQLEAAFLELLDLLIDAGAPKPEIIAWIRRWVSFLLDRPTSSVWPVERRAVWQILITWLQVGDDLLLQLQQRNAVTAAEEVEEGDPIAGLPANFEIGIFVGEVVGSVKRAEEILRRRNPGVKVRAVAAHGMTAQVEAAARHVDWAVVVTTYMGHALFYGIEPLLRTRPIYPRSRGTVAILEAIEARARTDSITAH